MQPFFLAPLVMAMRLPVIALETFRMMHGRAPTDGARPESERMVTEKIAAMQEGAVEAMAELARANLEITLRFMGGDAHGASHAAHGVGRRVARAAAAPAAKRVRRNARRLMGP